MILIRSSSVRRSPYVARRTINSKRRPIIRCFSIVKQMELGLRCLAVDVRNPYYGEPNDCSSWSFRCTNHLWLLETVSASSFADHSHELSILGNQSTTAHCKPNALSTVWLPVFRSCRTLLHLCNSRSSFIQQLCVPRRTSSPRCRCIN